MEGDSTDEVTRLQSSLIKLTQEAKSKIATNHKALHEDATDINGTTVNSSNAPIPRPRIYSTGFKNTEDKYQVFQQTKLQNISNSAKGYYGDAKELKARNETERWDTSNEESFYEEVSIPSLILKTTT